MIWILIAALAAIAMFVAAVAIGGTIHAVNPSDEAGELDRTCPDPAGYYAARAARRTYR